MTQAAYNLDSRAREDALREKARELVSQLTLEEKVGQTLFRAPAIPRLGIPAYTWWNEALHGVARAGVATVFPQAVSLAASFDPELLRRVAELTGIEGRAKFNAQSRGGDSDIYKGLTFWSPNINIFRDPRWGRGQETYGEDPWLSGRLGVAFIEGLQQNGGEVLQAAACAKHFAVHSGPEALRHSFDVHPNAYDLADTYLPAFKACVREAGVEAVMGAYNRVFGEPACGSPYLLQELLRETWDFEGHVVSDCWAISDFYLYHEVSEGPVDAAALAMNSGCDLCCGEIYLHLTEAVRSGQVEESRLDEAVERLFVTRLKLGLLRDDDPLGYDAIDYDVVDSPAHRRVNLEVAERSIVLLKNAAPEGSDSPLLPLDRAAGLTLGVIGPNADSRRALVGNYEGTASRYSTVLTGLQDLLGDDARILYSEGCHLWRDRVQGLAAEAGDRDSEVKAVCEAADVIVCVLGLDASIEGEQGDTGNEFGSGDKETLNPPGRQLEILELALSAGKPVVLVLLSGSALIVPHDDPRLTAVIWAGYPGARGGDALARILYGECSPSACLPVTFYRTTEELPDFLDYNMQGRSYRYMTRPALYPFGYGLSYSRFRFEALGETRLAVPTADETVAFDVRVHNEGDMAARVNIQLYLSCTAEASAERPVPNSQLRGLQSIELAAGESRELRFELCRQDFELYDREGQRYLPEAAQTVSIGAGQDEARSLELRPETPARWTLDVPTQEG